jgi:hypothetical protein
LGSALVEKQIGKSTRIQRQHTSTKELDAGRPAAQCVEPGRHSPKKLGETSSAKELNEERNHGEQDGEVPAAACIAPRPTAERIDGCVEQGGVEDVIRRLCFSLILM